MTRTDSRPRMNVARTYNLPQESELVRKNGSCELETKTPKEQVNTHQGYSSIFRIQLGKPRIKFDVFARFTETANQKRLSHRQTVFRDTPDGFVEVVRMRH